MDSSFWFDIKACDGSLYISCHHKLLFPYKLFLSLKIVLVLANSTDPGEMWHFICVFTACQSTHLGVTSIQRVKYSKTCLKWPLKKKTKIGFQDL